MLIIKEIFKQTEKNVVLYKGVQGVGGGGTRRAGSPPGPKVPERLCFCTMLVLLTIQLKVQQAPGN